MSSELFWACPNVTVHQVQLSYPVWIPEGREDEPASWDVDFEAQPWKTWGGCFCVGCDDHVWPVRVEELELLARDRRTSA